VGSSRGSQLVAADSLVIPYVSLSRAESGSKKVYRIATTARRTLTVANSRQVVLAEQIDLLSFSHERLGFI